MKRIILLTISLFLFLTITVSAAGSVDKTATVVIQSGALDVTVDNNIDFGTVMLTGSSQTQANITTSLEVAVSDATGDGKGWDIRMNISPLTNLTPTALDGQQFDYTAAGSVVNGTGITASANAIGVAPLTDIGIINGDASALSGGITLNPGFLTLTVGANAVPGTYTGTATFSVVAMP